MVHEATRVVGMHTYVHTYYPKNALNQKLHAAIALWLSSQTVITVDHTNWKFDSMFNGTTYCQGCQEENASLAYTPNPKALQRCTPPVRRYKGGATSYLVSMMSRVPNGLHPAGSEGVPSLQLASCKGSVRHEDSMRSMPLFKCETPRPKNHNAQEDPVHQSKWRFIII